MRRILVAWVLLVLRLSADCYSQSECSAVLSETGRNQLLSINQLDQSAFFYKKICGSDQTAAGLQSAGEYFEVAKGMLNLTYSKASDYCTAEKSKSASHSYSYFEVSSVMETALDSWVRCLELTSKGLRFDPKLEKTKAMFSIYREGRANGIIYGIFSDNGTECKGMVNNSMKLIGETLNLQLPVADEWVVNCFRQKNKSSVEEGKEIYPETNISIATSEGGLSVTLPEEPAGTEKWASEISARLSTIEKSIKIDEDLISSIQNAALPDVNLSKCGWNEYQQALVNDKNAEAGLHPAANCPSGKVLVGFGLGSRPNEYRFYCCQLLLAKPKPETKTK